MVFIKKHLSFILIWIGLIAAYFSTRLYNILSLPIFTDEAIYIRWSQIAKQDAAWRFISLTDGKQPSFVWLNMITLKLFDDPLLAGRIVSVAAGFLGMVGIFFLASELFKSRKIGFITAALYVIYPFSLVYDRMALYDSLVSSIAIWSLYFAVLLVRRIRLDISLILGMVWGAGLLTKNNSLISIYLIPFTLLLFDRKGKDIKERFMKWFVYVALSAVIAFLMFSILRLSPFYHIIAEKTALFVTPLSDWIKNPLKDFYGNFTGLTDWFISYFTIPAFVLVVASLFLGKKKFWEEKLLLIIWFILPFIGLALTGRVLYPRFILFMTVFLLPIIAYGVDYILDHVKNNILKYALIAISVAMFLRSDFYILTDFARAPIAKPDTDQLSNAWPAGGGVKEVISFLSEKSKNQKIFVASEGTFGSLPTNSIEIYLDGNMNVGRLGIYPLPPQIPEELVKKAEKMPVYFVLNDSENPPATWNNSNFKLIAKYQKGIGVSHMSLYEVIPNR